MEPASWAMVFINIETPPFDAA